MAGLNLTFVGDALETLEEIEAQIEEYLLGLPDEPLEVSAAGVPIGSVSYLGDETSYQLAFFPSESSLLAESAKTIDLGKLEIPLGPDAKAGFAKYDVETVLGELYHDCRQVLGLDISKPPRGQEPKLESADGRKFSPIKGHELFNETQRTVYLAKEGFAPVTVGQVRGLEPGYDFSLGIRRNNSTIFPGLSAEETAKVFAQVLVAFRENWVQNYLEPAI